MNDEEECGFPAPSAIVPRNRRHLGARSTGSCSQGCDPDGDGHVYTVDGSHGHRSCLPMCAHPPRCAIHARPLAPSDRSLMVRVACHLPAQGGAAAAQGDHCLKRVSHLSGGGYGGKTCKHDLCSARFWAPPPRIRARGERPSSSTPSCATVLRLRSPRVAHPWPVPGPLRGGGRDWLLQLRDGGGNTDNGSGGGSARPMSVLSGGQISGQPTHPGAVSPQAAAPRARRREAATQALRRALPPRPPPPRPPPLARRRPRPLPPAPPPRRQLLGPQRVPQLHYVLNQWNRDTYGRPTRAAESERVPEPGYWSWCAEQRQMHGRTGPTSPSPRPRCETWCSGTQRMVQQVVSACHLLRVLPEPATAIATATATAPAPPAAAVPAADRHLRQQRPTGGSHRSHVGNIDQLAEFVINFTMQAPSSLPTADLATS